MNKMSGQTCQMQNIQRLLLFLYQFNENLEFFLYQKELFIKIYDKKTFVSKYL